jgi:biopolymer transport protein ExbB
MVEYFVDGGPFMWPILTLLIVGIGFTLERFYSLMMSSINSKKFFEEITNTLDSDGVSGAIEICNRTRGPVAEVFHAGLSRYDLGLDEVEKAIQNSGAVEMAFLEKNMIWLNAVVTIAPMLGFTGTVAGMVNAFDAIEAANNITPSVVAGGISQALLTTAFGLIVAMIIQVFQNVFVSRIDRLVLEMEEHSVQLIYRLHDVNPSKK